MTAPEKADIGDEASRPLILHTLPVIPATIQPIPDMDLRFEITTLNWPSKIVILGPRKVIETSNWPLKATMLGSEWRGDDLDLTINDCHSWSSLSYHDLELAIKDGHTWSQMMRLRPRFGSHWQPCLVPNNHHGHESALSDLRAWSYAGHKITT